MEFDNKTIVILGLVVIGVGALYVGNKDLALAVGAGLVGYLSKDAQVILSPAQPDYIENDDDGVVDDEEI